MNNLKRVLSLALASVMLIGMMVVGASAADFTDAEDIQHDEAVQSLVALGIVNGKEDGSYFAPQDNVTRGEMAKMIAVAMMGGNDVNTGVKTVPSFTDIAGHWAESYIEYCFDMGIISGRGDGTFDPNANVTGTEATKMVLSALGYDATAYKLTGASWATRTDELARIADPSLYEDLTGVTLNTPATRDTAAQIIWNGMQNNTRKVTPSTNTSTGEVTWQYNTGNTLLKVRYNADIYVGKYVGNYDTDSSTATNKGEIIVNGLIEGYYVDEDTLQSAADAAFPSDMDISNIGEEVKVIFKDGTGGRTGRPDRKDTIYGVFNTGKTEVYNITKNDMQDAKEDLTNTANGKIKFGGSLYNVADSVSVVTNYKTAAPATYATASTEDANGNKTAAAKVQKALKSQAADTIKFVANDAGKIYAAYVVEKDIGKVTSVTSSKVSVQGLGTVDISGNDIYDGVKKDDVVVFSKLYKDKAEDAHIVLTKAETVEGQLTAYKINDDGDLVNVDVDGTTYKTHDKLIKTGLTDDDLSKDDMQNSLKDNVVLYMIGSLAGCVDSPENSAGNYALITGSSVDEAGDVQKKIDAEYSALNVKVLLPDGTTAKYDVHKDSTFDGETKLTYLAGVENDKVGAAIGSNDPDKIAAAKATRDLATICAGALADEALDVTPVLVKYTLSGGTIKIKEFSTRALYKAEGQAEKLWDKTTKTLKYISDNEETSVNMVAATNAVLFVYSKTNDKFYAYDLRSLGNIKTDDVNEDTDIQYFTKDGQVVAAFASLDNKASSSSAATKYGIVTGFNKTTKASDDTLYYNYSIWTGDETLKVDVEEDNDMTILTTGNILTFDEAPNNTYTVKDFTLIDAYTDKTTSDEGVTTAAYYEPVESKDWTVVAVDTYSASKNMITFFQGKNKAAGDATQVADKTKPGSYTVSDDVVIVYVDGKEQDKGDDNGVASYNPTAGGYLNAILHFDKDGVVDAIIVESSEKISLSGAPVVSALKVSMDDESTPGCTLSTDKVAPGGTFTVKVKNVVEGDKVTITGTGIDGLADKTLGNSDITEGTFTATLKVDAAAKDAISVKVTVTHAG